VTIDHDNQTLVLKCLTFLDLDFKLISSHLLPKDEGHLVVTADILEGLKVFSLTRQAGKRLKLSLEATEESREDGFIRGVVAATVISNTKVLSVDTQGILSLHEIKHNIDLD
jgi:hypothetical protein